MCDDVSRAISAMPEPSRRKFLETMGLAAATGGVLAAGGFTAHATEGARPRSGGSHRTQLVLLGTGGGPTLLNGERAGISTAIVYEDRVYAVDLGIGAFLRLVQSGIAPQSDRGGSSLSTMRAILFTHLHSDHFTDWPAVYATGKQNTSGRTAPPIKVFGPGDRGTLPRLFPPERTPPPVFSPEDPTPGIKGMTGYLRRAFSQDFNDRARDGGFRDPDELFQPHEIDLSGVWTVDPDGVPPRLTAPIEVWQDDDVRITATLVDHPPTAPAFAYRFDTPDGSIVVSGDTTVSQNLIDLAENCDYLVHEVIDSQFVDELVAARPDDAERIRSHLLGAHTTAEQVGRDVAEPAGAKNLVLTHFVPGNSPRSRWQVAQRGYSGRLIVGDDLMRLGVGT